MLSNQRLQSHFLVFFFGGGALSGEHLPMQGRYGMRIGLFCFDATRRGALLYEYSCDRFMFLKFKQLDRAGNFKLK